MFTIGSLFQETWSLLKARYGLFMASVAIVGAIHIAFNILTWVVPFWQTKEDIFGLGDVLGLFISPVLQVGLGFVALQAYRKNEIDVSGVFAGFSQFWRVLGVSYLLGLLGMVAGISILFASGAAFGLFYSLASSQLGGWFGVALVLFPALVVVLIVSTRLAFAVFVCFDTKCSVMESFGEAWRRTKDVYWKLLGAQLLLLLMALGSILLLVLPFVFFWAPFAVAYLGVVLGKLLEGQSGHNETSHNNLEPPENPAFPGPLNG